MHLLFDCRGHKRCEPPARHFGPEGGVDDIEGLQLLFVLIAEGVVHMFDPPDDLDDDL